MFSHTPESAAVAQFASLWQRYSTVRMLASESLKKPDPVRAMQFYAAFGIGASAGLANDFAASIRTLLPEGRAKVTYGGLGLEKLDSLMRRYKSGRRDLSAYLLVCLWKRELAKHPPKQARGLDPRLVELTLEAMRRAIAAGNAKFFRELAGAMDAVKEAAEFTQNGRWDHNPADEWQFGLLLYMRTCPKPKYRMREFRNHLNDEIGFTPDVKTIRNFCGQHGIALDASPGAPRMSERQAGK